MKKTLILAIFLLPLISFASIDYNLRFGDKTNDVIKLQNFLIEKEILDAGNNTGYFGPLTLKGVKKYQASVGVPNTGFVGPLTREKVNAELPAQIPSTKPLETTSSTATTSTAMFDPSYRVSIRPTEEGIVSILGSNSAGSSTGMTAVFPFEVLSKNGDTDKPEARDFTVSFYSADGIYINAATLSVEVDSGAYILKESIVKGIVTARIINDGSTPSGMYKARLTSVRWRNHSTEETLTQTTGLDAFYTPTIANFIK